jgi:8-oxo-dGTP pyrophosphatase MutT (NUDIX family)
VPPPVAPRPAATLLLVREGRDGPEVLMVERPARGYFGGLMVFPGGAVEPVDRGPLAAAVVTGSGPDHEFRSAALREAAEEIGIALTPQGWAPAPFGQGESLFEALHRAGTRLDGAGLVLISRWVTPSETPVRFDTRFFVTRVVGDPQLRIDPDELVGHRWARPGDVLAAHERSELELILPTIAHLRWLARRDTLDGIIASAKGADGRTLIEPGLMEDGSLVPIHMPAER